ncbi:MaoC family dehydratase [Haloglomus litoreum]|uniref:MaoC family dehydratase n=1 Tax=Haloglomus litoreum TaxID=3034026 RepID=UPI0023E8EC94|nr:MaoC family dehydratase N-terminal domain-containing protein [Haloglomus sp. DT116]
MSSQLVPDAHEDEIGTTREHEVGAITRRDVRRYARAVEDENPLFHDVDAAREHGYDDLVVPPNFLPAIIERSTGSPADDLREDGLDPNLYPIELPPDAILMGGGQDLTIDAYATAGAEITVHETLTDIYQRDSDSMGQLTFIELHSEYFTDGDTRVMSCDETVIVGDRQ